ncbi:hypothetical protein ACWDD9_28720 [Kitasatospora sp. NPDC001119]
MPAHIEALRRIRLSVVGLAADLTASRPSGTAPHRAGLALRDAALGLAEVDQHLAAANRNIWHDHATGSTRTADPSGHHLALRRSELVLDRAATGLQLAAERASARSGLRAGAARVRSAFARRATPTGAPVTAAPHTRALPTGARIKASR